MSRVVVETISTQVDQTFVALGGERLEAIGVVTAEIGIGEGKVVTQFYALKKGSDCLLGLETAEVLGVLSFN